MPSWSPDGRTIAFQSDRDGNLEMYVLNSDGSRAAESTQNAAFDPASFHSAFPPTRMLSAWSPDGRRIAFQSDRDGNREIYIVNADGSGQTQIDEPCGADAIPGWSPDGRTIAFVRRVGRTMTFSS